MINEGFSRITQCALERVLANPYQPREGEDPAHVAKIAESILQEGLLQVPVGRVVDEHKIELAFGHTRLGAFRLLHKISYEHGDLGSLDKSEFPALARLLARRDAGELSDGEKGRFLYLPVNVRVLNNSEMFRLAVSENLARKDLTPLEEARAMVRYRSEFSKTSAEIGDLFGLSESAVRNKMRLLDLPAEVLEGFKAGTLTEGAARELLRLFDLPESVRRAAERPSYHESLAPSYIIKCALRGELASSIKKRVDDLIDMYKEELAKAPWKWDEVLELDEDDEKKALPLCKGCAYNRLKNEVRICLDKGCYWDKNRAWQQRYVVQAAAAVGLPAVLERKTSSDPQSFFYHGDFAALEVARDAQCPNLAVIYSGYKASAEEGGLDLAGYPSAKIICTKRKGFCTCIQATKANVELRPAVALPAPVQTMEERPTAAVESAPVTRAAITTEELQEAARQTRKLKKQAVDECRQLLQQAGLVLAIGLMEKNPAVWKMILSRMDYSSAKDKAQNITEIAAAIGLQLAKSVGDPEYQVDSEYLRKQYNRMLRDAGLTELMSVSMETVQEGGHV